MLFGFSLTLPRWKILYRFLTDAWQIYLSHSQKVQEQASRLASIRVKGNNDRPFRAAAWIRQEAEAEAEQDQEYGRYDAFT